MASASPSVAGDSLVLLTPTSNVTDIRTLDDKIATKVLELRNLRRQRNTLLPIYRLAPETLQSIFIHYASIYDEKHRCARLPAWVNVSYVCHHWREVALNCPTLWSFLFMFSPRWTDALLARSKMAPLKFRMDSGECKKQHSHLSGFFEKLALQAGRLQSLQVVILSVEARCIRPLLSVPAPILRTLEITVRSEWTPFVRPLFNTNTPALRRLQLVGYAFPLTSPTLCGLRFLSLANLDTSCRPPLAEFCVALSHMQDLMQLILENALPSVSCHFTDTALKNPKKFTLPRLSHLVIIEPFPAIVLLLSWFDLPMRTKVRLQCHLKHDDGDYTSICPLLSKRFISSDQDFDPAPIIRACTISGGSRPTRLTFSTDQCNSCLDPLSLVPFGHSPVVEGWDHNVPLEMDFDLRDLNWAPQDFVDHIYGSIPLNRLQCVHVTDSEGDIDISENMWRGTFGHLQELRHIRQTGCGLRSLIKALSPHHGPQDEGGNLELGLARVFAPALEVLEFHNVTFSKRYYGRVHGNLEHCDWSLACLSNALSARQREGYGLQRLVFNGCKHLDNVESLKGVVTEVDWDEVEDNKEDVGE